MSESSVGESSVFVGRQSVMPDRNGLCNIVSSIGAFVSMVTICPAASPEGVGIVEGVADGWRGVL
jgi:hypothetical protein